ncbi:MAG: cell division protein FtsA [Coprobacter fastidiosus]
MPEQEQPHYPSIKTSSRYVVTIPFGGRNITQDISSLNILMSEAERLKLAFGCAINNGEEPKGIGIEGIDSSKINYQELCRVTEARIEEIVANIVEQMKKSGYKDQLSAGIILTGGASLLKELPELLARNRNIGCNGVMFKKELHSQDIKKEV